MRYVLDFDEVIFNTTALKQKMHELGIPESERGLEVFERLTEADPDFDFTSLLYPSARRFIETHGDNISVISSAFSVTAKNNTDEEKQLEFQREKIRRTGIGSFVDPKQIHVVGAEKSEMLAALQQQFGDELVFVDDRERYLREANELGIRSIWMDHNQKGSIENKEGVSKTPNFPRVGSFDEIHQVIASWENKA